MAHVIQEHNRLISSRDRAGNFGKSCASQPPADQTSVHSVGMHPLNCAAPTTCIPTKFLRGNSGLTRVEIALLAYVMDHPGRALNRATLAEECDCAPNSIPRAARKLEALGLIEREAQPGKPMIYGRGRNLDVTPSSNIHVSGNVDVTPPAPTRNVDVTPLDVVSTAPKQTTTHMVVTDVTGTRNIPPQTPLYNITPISKVSSNLESPETSLERGLGRGLFGEPAEAAAAKPNRAKAPPKRRRREKFYATEASMPAEPNPAMLEYAAAKGMRNGTLAEQHSKFRRWHIREQTLIACIEQRWETWVDNWAKSNPVRPSGECPPGYKLGGIGPDGKQRYLKDQRNNVYR